jgi:hypothetical protein
MVIRSVIIPRNRDFVDLIVAGFNLKSGSSGFCVLL